MTRPGLHFESGKDGRRIQAKLRQLSGNVDDLTPAWPKVQRYISRIEEAQFRTTGVRLGKKWDPLDPDYRRQKIAAGDGGQTLVLTGGLKDSFTGKGRYALKDWGRQTAVFGSRHPLAHLHQRGTSGGRVPARPILVIRVQERRAIVKIIRDHVSGKG